MGDNYISFLTGGLVPSGNSQTTSIITNGLTNTAGAIPVVGQTQAATQANGTTTGLAIPKITEDVTVSSSADQQYFDLIPAPSNTQLLDTVPLTQLNPANFAVKETSPDGGYISYAGTNIQALIEVGDNPNGTARFAKQLIEMTAISVSIHRANSAAWSLGFTGAKGYARGRRTVAGTMIFTQFTKDVLAEFLNASIVSDLSKDTTYVKVDQLPLFNLTLLFTSEYGYMSYRRLYGISFVTDGTIYSTNDLMTEQTISYVASDFTPLKSIKDTNNFTSILTNRMVSVEQTPLSILASKSKT
ncbi:MAG: hypothetical protein ACRYGG_16210 [Janthinobacterium lividum]